MRVGLLRTGSGIRYDHTPADLDEWVYLSVWVFFPLTGILLDTPALPALIRTV